MSYSEIQEQLYFMDLIRKCNVEIKDFPKMVANKFNVSDSTSRRWEDGIVKPDPEFREKIINWISTFASIIY